MKTQEQIQEKINELLVDCQNNLDKATAAGLSSHEKEKLYENNLALLKAIDYLHWVLNS